MHLVHTNIKYSTFNEAKTKANGLAVLGVFIDVCSCLVHCSENNKIHGLT